MCQAARRWFTLTAMALLLTSAVAPWRTSCPVAGPALPGPPLPNACAPDDAVSSQNEMAYRPETLRGYVTFLMIPLLLAGASEGAESDFWMALASAAGWLGVVGYVVVRGSNPDASWRVGMWLVPAVVGFAVLTLSGDPPVWRFWSWGLWLLWVGLGSSVLLEATLLRRRLSGLAR
jgi:hypothetical protein